MAVQQEIKSQLAKLLATEDIVVEHKHCETAQFNVESRVLILPIWEKASNDVYDMLVGHEVGHALFTPNEDPPKNVPHQFMNVVEDARIEKLMKRKYMGIAKSFYRGYNELHEQDFFELDGEDISNLNLADRANLHFKIGSFLPISFSDAEKEIITLIQNAETFTDTIAAAEALYNYCKQEQEKQKEFLENTEQAKLDFEINSQGSGNIDIDSDTDNESTVSDTDSSSTVEDRGDSTPSNDRMVNSDSPVEDDDGDDLKVNTLDRLDKKLRDLVGSGATENEYLEIPKVNLDYIIAKNEEIYEHIDAHWEYTEEQYEKYSSENIFGEVDGEYEQFKKDAQKEVNYLVKEFECKKSASAYARAATSRTGVLDTSKLHTYKFNEDIFKKVTVLPDGKNHGLIFILDWSGSMQYVLNDTLKQLYNLIWFCRKVQIPFEVYAFTQEWERGEEKISKAEHRENVLVIEDEFNLLNLFSSKVNSRVLDKQLKDIWRISLTFSRRSLYTYPRRLSLSGTPLNESLICLHEIIPQFRKDNDVEKVQCIVLSDGESNTIPYHKTVERHWENEPFLGQCGINPHKCHLRDRKLGRTYTFGYAWHEFTGVLLTHLKDKFPSTNFIGIRVLSPRDAGHFIRMYGSDEKVQNDWRKNKTFAITNAGYDTYFGMSSAALAQDTEFDVDESATKAQIKRAFVKSLKTKKLNKKMLSEFVELVA